MRFSLICLLCTILLPTYAQISGVVVSAKTKAPEEGVEVFINHSSIATVTTADGRFRLDNLTEGYAEIILYKKGFDLFRSMVRIQPGRAYQLSLSIQPTPRSKSSTASAGSIASVKAILSARAGAAEGLTGLLETKVGDSLVFTAVSPVELENRDLGIKATCYIMGLSSGNYREMPVRYSYLMPGDLREELMWDRNRMNVYDGSFRHWLGALYDTALVRERFKMTRDGVEVNVAEIAQPSANGNIRLQIEHPLTITYRRSDGTEETSTISTAGPVIAHARGGVLNARLLSMAGAMGWKHPDVRLPVDYVAIPGNVEKYLKEKARLLFEKVYVHTDKPYYYPGEAIWMKIYVNYYSPGLSQQLSAALHVELIGPARTIVQRKTYRIDRGMAWGDLTLADSLKGGQYYLRAYTQLGRNFGQESMFLKPFHILDAREKVTPITSEPVATRSGLLTVETDKPIYKTRERVTVSLKTDRNEEANLSVSVTDAIQVVPIEEAVSIRRARIDTTRIVLGEGSWYPPESGITYRGMFVDDRNKPQKGATLGFTQTTSASAVLVETDDRGVFTLGDLQHYDSAVYFFNSDRSVKTPYGKIVPMSPDIPPLDFVAAHVPINTISTNSVQRIISEYEAPNDARMLDEVEIRASLIGEPGAVSTKRPFGRGDFIFTNKDFNPTHENILLTLQGKVPGLGLRQSGTQWTVSIQRALNSFSGAGSPLVIVDNVIMQGDAINNVLANMHPSNVESIEVRTRPSAIFGSRGTQGVIMVYTKNGVTTPTDSNFRQVTIPGFSLSHPFLSPNYDDQSAEKTQADYRSILYWSPNVTIDPADGRGGFSFFTSDLPGRYRIVVQGFTSSGEPIYAEHYITVDTN